MSEAPFCVKHNRYLDGKGLCDKCQELVEELASLRREHEELHDVLRLIKAGYNLFCTCPRCSKVQSFLSQSEGKGEGV